MPETGVFTYERNFSTQKSPQESETGLDILIARGYNPEFEAKRAKLLINTLGPLGATIASREQKNSREMYQREFLDDEPVSRPGQYWHIDNTLYSYPHQHSLVEIQSGIDRRERDGVMWEGFQKFQELTTNPTNPDSVVVWYSPAGIGGSTPPFDKVHFDAGRLYVAFKQNDESSIHFDIKVHETQNIDFPILQALNRMSGRESQSEFDYLREPFSIATPEEFFNKIAQQKDLHEKNIYISRREDSTLRKERTYLDVMNEMYWAHQYSLPNGDSVTVNYYENAIKEEDYARLYDPRAIDKSYKSQIEVYAITHNLQYVTLYGCSTTSVAKGMYNPGAVMSAYNTAERIIASGGPLGSGGSGGIFENIDLAQCSDLNILEKKIECCHCGLCGETVTATIRGGRIYCAPKDKGGCGKSVQLN